MLGLGWFEMLVIGIAALIFIGPKDLPVVMNRVGKIAGQIRRMGNEFQREINKTTGLDEVRNLRQSITAPLKKTTDEIRREFNAMTPTGVKPTGVIKPADPKAESVVEEIRAAAGMPAHADPAKLAANARAAAAVPADPMLEALEGKRDEPAPAPIEAPQPAPKRAPVKAKAAPTRPVITTELAPLEDKALVVSEPAPVPMVVETPAPRKRATRKSAATTPAAEAAAPEATAEPTTKTASRKRAAKPAAPTPSAGNE